MYSYKEHMGGFILYRPDGTDFAFLQPGDDSKEFRGDIEAAQRYWDSPVANPGVFESLAHQISVICNAYDMGDDQ